MSICVGLPFDYGTFDKLFEISEIGIEIEIPVPRVKFPRLFDLTHFAQSEYLAF